MVSSNRRTGREAIYMAVHKIISEISSRNFEDIRRYTLDDVIEKGLIPLGMPIVLPYYISQKKDQMEDVTVYVPNIMRVFLMEDIPEEFNGFICGKDFGCLLCDAYLVPVQFYKCPKEDNE